MNNHNHAMNNCVMQVAEERHKDGGTLPRTRTAPIYRRLYSIPTERLGLERKVGEGIFMMQRTHSVKARRVAQYDKYIRKCMELISDPSESRSITRIYCASDDCVIAIASEVF
jgi:hypothetical protein